MIINVCVFNVVSDLLKCSLKMFKTEFSVATATFFRVTRFCPDFIHA